MLALALAQQRPGQRPQLTSAGGITTHHKVLLDYLAKRDEAEVEARVRLEQLRPILHTQAQATWQVMPSIVKGCDAGGRSQMTLTERSAPSLLAMHEREVCQGSFSAQPGSTLQPAAGGRTLVWQLAQKRAWPRDRVRSMSPHTKNMGMKHICWRWAAKSKRANELSAGPGHRLPQQWLPHRRPAPPRKGQLLLAWAARLEFVRALQGDQKAAELPWAARGFAGNKGCAQGGRRGAASVLK